MEMISIDGHATADLTVLDDMKTLLAAYVDVKDDYDALMVKHAAAIGGKDKEICLRYECCLEECLTMSTQVDGNAGKDLEWIRSRSSSENKPNLQMAKRAFKLEEELEQAIHGRKVAEAKTDQLEKQRQAEIEIRYRVIT